MRLVNRFFASDHKIDNKPAFNYLIKNKNGSDVPNVTFLYTCIKTNEKIYPSTNNSDILTKYINDI